MLCLVRYPGEELYIGPDITVEVLKVEAGRRVHLGITAPRSVKILRDDAQHTTPRGESSGNIDPDFQTSLAFARVELLELESGQRSLSNCPAIAHVGKLIAAANA